MPAVPAWLIDPLWVQFDALLPVRPVYAVSHPLSCHRRRIADRIVFDKLIQLLRFGCSYEAIADTTCSATTIRTRRDEWIKLGVFARMKQIALQTYDRIVGLVLEDVAVDGCITKAPGGGELAGRSPADRGKQGMKRSLLVDGYGIPLGRVLAPANRNDSPLLAPTLDALNGLELVGIAMLVVSEHEQEQPVVQLVVLLDRLVLAACHPAGTPWGRCWPGNAAGWTCRNRSAPSQR